jgi:hypothetical protein
MISLMIVITTDMNGCGTKSMINDNTEASVEASVETSTNAPKICTTKVMFMGTVSPINKENHHDGKIFLLYQ